LRLNIVLKFLKNAIEHSKQKNYLENDNDENFAKRFQINLVKREYK